MQGSLECCGDTYGDGGRGRESLPRAGARLAALEPDGQESRGCRGEQPRVLTVSRSLKVGQNFILRAKAAPGDKMEEVLGPVGPELSPPSSLGSTVAGWGPWSPWIAKILCLEWGGENGGAGKGGTLQAH